MGYNPEDLTLALDLAAEHVKSVSYSSPAARTVAALVAAASHVPQAFSHLPRVFVHGPYGTGKSTFLSAVQPLVQNPVRNSGQLSSTFAYRNDFRSAAVDGQTPVSFIDETKHIFKENGKGGSSHPAYAILTEGYSKAGAPIKFQEKDMNAEYSCFQVAFTASRGPQALPEDVLQRAITLELARKPDGMQLGAVTDPSVAKNGRDIGLFLRTAVQSAEKPLRIIARDTDWYARAGLDNRTADVWAPLFAVAELAGAQWPALVSSAYAELGSKSSRNLPSAFQVKVDALSFLHSTGTDPEKIPARGLIDYLRELGRGTYTWDDAPFTIKRFGMELKTAGVEAYRSNGAVYYRVSDAWMKQADRIASPVSAEPEDPDNDWSALDDLL